MKFSDVETYLTTGLTNKGYTAIPKMVPGPWTSQLVQKASPQSLIIVEVGGGAGLTTELLFDRPFISVHAYGNQFDYAGAEKLAGDLDHILLAADHNTLIGTAKVLYVTRTGAGPALTDFDSANRYRFSCTYLTESQTGL